MKQMAHPRRLNILVAEDDDADFLFLKFMLKKVTTAALVRVGDGEDAINYLKGAGKYGDRAIHPLPDILLLDLRLPKISGHEVLEWLRSQADLQSIRVYVLAASDHESDRNRVRQSGVQDYFVKPLSLGHLAVLFDT